MNLQIENAVTHISLSLRNNSFFRLLLLPWMRYIKKREMVNYCKGMDSKIIGEMKDTHKGERCFIVLNGPSLKAEDLDKISSEFSFGCNRIYDIYSKTIWRPNIYMTVDKALLQSRGKQDWLKLIDSEMFCYLKKGKVPVEIRNHYHEIVCYGKFRVHKFNDVPEVSKDVSKYFSITSSVSIAMLEFAIYMGFSKIFIIGCDHNFCVEVNKDGSKILNNDIKPHFSEHEDKTIYASNKEALTESYEKIKAYAESIGVKVFNATRGGKLEVFKRVNFDDLF